MDPFGARRVPLLARRNYLIEVRHLIHWGAFVGIFEGTVSSIVAAKTFNAGPWLITIVMASPMLSNLMGLAWGAIATGRRKLPLFMMFAGAATAGVASVAVTPPTALGGWVFAAQILLARVMLSGCMTVRASLWKHNYPATVRGRIAARLQTVRFSMSIVTIITVSLLFDFDPAVYRYVYPIAAAIGCAGIFALRRMHVRGERTELAAIAGRPPSAGARPGLSLLSPIRSMIEVFRADRDFARYCLALALLGSANMMIMPVMTIIITKELFLSYYHSCNLMEVLPRFLMMGSLMPWADLFDRVGVVRFRVVNGCVWVGAPFFGGLGAAMIHYVGLDSAAGFAAAATFIALGRVCGGLARGGGAIAWNLGHLHFAQSDKAETYMGIHVFLTGVRGLTLPFLGTFLYLRFGPAAFAVMLAFALVGTATFAHLAKRAQPRGNNVDSDKGLVKE